MTFEQKKQIVIDNSFKVDCNINMTLKEAYEKGFNRGLSKAPKSKVEQPQGEFTNLEKEVTADAINYLLGAELLEENGYTEEVINALKSALQKLGAEEDHL